MAEERARAEKGAETIAAISVLRAAADLANAGIAIGRAADSLPAVRNELEGAVKEINRLTGSLVLLSNLDPNDKSALVRPLFREISEASPELRRLVGFGKKRS
jgi:hypothetical protein